MVQFCTMKPTNKIAEEKQAYLKNAIRSYIEYGLTLPLMLSMIAMMLGSHAAIVHFSFSNRPVSAVCSCPILCRCSFYKGAYHAIKTKAPNMDVLVAIGTSAAFALSIYNGFSVDTPRSLF